MYRAGIAQIQVFPLALLHPYSASPITTIPNPAASQNTSHRRGIWTLDVDPPQGFSTFREFSKSGTSPQKFKLY